MPRSLPSNPNHPLKKRYTPIAEYLRLKNFKWQRLWKQAGEFLVTFIDNEWVNEKEFDAKYMKPVPTSFTSNPENINQRKNYSL